MSGTEAYHERPQPFRIQKRLVLNQCFKCIQSNSEPTRTLNYVTFGGEDLYDIMDLVAVFDIRHHKLNIVSYEENETKARQSEICPVAITLSRVSTISVEIVPAAFSENVRPLRTLRPSGPFIYFLDDTKTFRENHADTLLQLLKSALLREGDWLLITSCLTPRVVHQSRFMERHNGAFKLFYGPQTTINVDFRMRNHVDLLVALALSQYQQVTDALRRRPLYATLFRKFKYRDTQTAMGLWLYRIEMTDGHSSVLRDQPFEEFPLAFEKVPEKEEEVPNIFDKLIVSRKLTKQR